jgi:hypothetical protein
LFSANSWAYLDMPSLSNQLVTCCIAAMPRGPRSKACRLTNQAKQFRRIHAAYAADRES